jgi:hypothetical protein
MQPTTGDWVVMIIVGGALTIGLISMLIGQIVRLWDWLTVNRFRSDKHIVMSSAASENTQNAPLSLRQTAVQTDRPPMSPSLSRDVMLDMYRLLRMHGVPREKARPILKAAGLPLDNNLWSEAIPPDEEAPAMTPIAGRPTRARYQDDPELVFEPPPQ